VPPGFIATSSSVHLALVSIATANGESCADAHSVSCRQKQPPSPSAQPSTHVRPNRHNRHARHHLFPHFSRTETQTAQHDDSRPVYSTRLPQADTSLTTHHSEVPPIRGTLPPPTATHSYSNLSHSTAHILKLCSTVTPSTPYSQYVIVRPPQVEHPRRFGPRGALGALSIRPCEPSPAKCSWIRGEIQRMGERSDETIEAWADSEDGASTTQGRSSGSRQSEPCPGRPKG
jgi:hypothetical protein